MGQTMMTPYKIRSLSFRARLRRGPSEASVLIAPGAEWLFVETAIRLKANDLGVKRGIHGQRKPGRPVLSRVRVNNADDQ